MEISKKYLPLAPSESYTENTLEVTVGYDLGGYNWYSGGENKRGYYLYAIPMTKTTNKMDDGREYNTYSQQVGKGLKLLLKEVSRQSKKSAQEAIAMAAEKEAMVIERVCEQYGLVLADT